MTVLQNLTALIHEAETEAGRGSGLSDVIYEARIQRAYKSILSRASNAEREETKKKLLERGFNPYFDQPETEVGVCRLTGVDEHCCPCGRHPLT